MPADRWSPATRHGAVHSVAQSWHRALLPSQQLGKSTVTVLAAAAPNLPACQIHVDPLNTAAHGCLHEGHSHPEKNGLFSTTLRQPCWPCALCQCSDFR